MTDKEIFIQIKTHLLSQGKKSMGEYPREDDTITGCVYRSSEGLKCAVGCIIKEEYYTPILEGKGVTNLLVRSAVTRSLGLETLPDSTLEMLSRLQDIHDLYPVNTWETYLQEYEGKFNSNNSTASGEYIYT
jgi:hypothetical protein